MITQREAKQLTIDTTIYMLDGINLRILTVVGITRNTAGNIQIKTQANSIEIDSDEVLETMFLNDADAYRAQLFAIEMHCKTLNDYLNVADKTTWYRRKKAEEAKKKDVVESPSPFMLNVGNIFRP